MKHIALAAFVGLAVMACSPSEPVVENAPVESSPEQVASSSDPTTPPPTDPGLTDPAATPPPPPADGDTCGLMTHAAIIGQPASDAAVPAASPAVRHIRPDTQVTMDFRPDRLNIDISAEGVITGLRCG